jgi:hypothetical protein
MRRCHVVKTNVLMPSRIIKVIACTLGFHTLASQRKALQRIVSLCSSRKHNHFS